MAEIGIIYGTSTNRTEEVAEMVAERLGVDNEHVKNITDCSPDDLLAYDVLIFGIPTWNTGELQEDWEEFMPNFDEMDLNDKTIAFFGLGDAVGYPFTYQDAIGIVYDAVVERGAKVVGHWPTEGYTFDESAAIKVDGKFCGLSLDQDNEEDLTDERLDGWVAQLKQELGLEAAS